MGGGLSKLCRQYKNTCPQILDEEGPSWLKCLTVMILSCFLGMGMIYLNTFLLSHCMARLYHTFSRSLVPFVICLVIFILYLIWLNIGLRIPLGSFTTVFSRKHDDLKH